MQFFFLSSQYSSTAGQCSRLRSLSPSIVFQAWDRCSMQGCFWTYKQNPAEEAEQISAPLMNKPKTVMLWNTNEWNSWFWPPVGIITHRVKDKHIILLTADEYVVSRMGNKMLKSMYLPISIETCLFWRSRAQTVSCTKRSWKWT